MISLFLLHKKCVKTVSYKHKIILSFLHDAMCLNLKHSLQQSYFTITEMALCITSESNQDIVTSWYLT